MKKIIFSILVIFTVLGCNNTVQQPKEPYQEVIDDYANKYSDKRPAENILSEKEVVAGVLEDVYLTRWDEVKAYKQQDPDWQSITIGQVTLVEDTDGGEPFYFINAVNKDGWDIKVGRCNAIVGKKTNLGEASATNMGQFAPDKTLTKQEAIDLAKKETGAIGDAQAKAVLTDVPNNCGSFSWGWAVQFNTKADKTYWINSRIYDDNYFKKNNINNDSLRSQVLIGELSANVFDKSRVPGPVTIKPIKYCKE